MVVFTIIYGLGILLGSHLDYHPLYLFIATCVCLIAAALLLVRGLRQTVYALAVCCLLGGSFAFSLFQMPKGDDVSHLIPRGGVKLEGTIASDPALWEGYATFFLAAEELLLGDDKKRKAQPVTGRLRVTADDECLVVRESEEDDESYHLLRRGDRIRLTGRLRSPRPATNLGQFSTRAHLARQGVYAEMSCTDPSQIGYQGQGKLGLIDDWSARFHRGVLERLEQTMPPPFSANFAQLLSSILFGIRASPVPKEVAEVFREAGTMHILVVSGSQISLLFMLVYLPGWLAGVWAKRRQRRLAPMGPEFYGMRYGSVGAVGLMVAILMAIAYAALTEGGQSVVRATIMGSMVGVALLLQSSRVAEEHGLVIDRYTLLALAGAIILIAQPPALFNPGFQFSFAAVWGLLYLTPKFQPFLGFLPRWIAFLVSASTGAQLAMAPFLAWHFHSIPVMGLITNLVAVPLAGILLVTGLIACLAATISIGLACVINRFNWILLYGLLEVTSFLAARPGALLPVWSHCLPFYLAYFALLIALGEWLSRTKRSEEEEDLED